MKRLSIVILSLLVITGFVFAQSITVTSPHSGDTWYKGNSYNITWTKTGTMDANVKITLYDPPGTNLIHVITMNTPNDGSYNWTIPNSILVGNYIVRVKTTDNLYFDNSDIFSITDPPGPAASITVTSPHSGDTWYKGNTNNITWANTGNTGVNVKINTFKDAIDPANFVEQLTGPNSGTKSWTIPSTYDEGTYYIRIKGVDSSWNDVGVHGDSGPFSIKYKIELVTTFTVTPVQLKPDLAINGKITRTPKHPGMGESFKIQFQIINNGKGKAVASNAELIIKGPEFNKVERFPVAEFPRQGDFINYAFDYKLDKMGIYKFTLKLDVDNDNTESNENNNEKFILVDVNPRADLIVCVDNDRDAMVAIHKKTITSVVKNIGAFQSVPCKLELYIEGIGTNYYDIPVLKPGESHTVTDKKKWFTAGKKSIRATIDSNNDVKEFKEDNNYVEGYFNAYTAGFKPKYHTAVKVKCSDNTEAGSWDEIK